jgi:hypothetical protein
VAIQGPEILELLRVLGMGGALTAAVVQTGRIVLEWVRGRNRIAEIKATNEAEIRKLQVELQLERERNRALTSSQLSLGSPPG